MQPLEYLNVFLDVVSEERSVDESMNPRTERPYDPNSVDDMIDWCECNLESQQGDRMKIRGLPRIELLWRWLILKLQVNEKMRVAVEGSRGGGKTFMAAGFELLSMRWFGASATNLGGSLEQAIRCYRHIKSSIASSEDLQGFILGDPLMKRTQSIRGDDIEVLAASDKSVRGAHPKGSSGRGTLVVDEAAMVPDDLQGTAEKQVVTARPSGVLLLSTMGVSMRGRFQKIVDEGAPITQTEIDRLEAKLASGDKTKGPSGFFVFRYDTFDVARRCEYDCATTCPSPDHFANDYYTNGKLDHEAFCGGKAHDTDGWVDVDETAAQLDSSVDLGEFKRELMGIGSESVGKVYLASTIKEASIDDLWLSKGRDVESHQRRFLALEKAIGLDWGWAGQTCAVSGFRLGPIVVAYKYEFWTGTRFSVIREEIAERMFSERIGTFRPDGSNPSDNEEMSYLLNAKWSAAHHQSEKARQGAKEIDPVSMAREVAWSAQVDPVNFSKEKVYGIGQVRGRLESKTNKLGTETPMLLLPKKVGGEPVEGWRRFIDYLAAYHYDDKGKPAKVDDHAPDALLCLCLTWSSRRTSMT